VLRSTGSNEDSVINVHDDFSLWSKWRDPDQFDHHKCSPTDAHVSAAQLYKVVAVL
jgi:quinol monooxygenase YgiN